MRLKILPVLWNRLDLEMKMERSKAAFDVIKYRKNTREIQGLWLQIVQINRLTSVLAQKDEARRIRDEAKRNYEQALAVSQNGQVMESIGANGNHGAANSVVPQDMYVVQSHVMSVT